MICRRSRRAVQIIENPKADCDRTDPHARKPLEADRKRVRDLVLDLLRALARPIREDDRLVVRQIRDRVDGIERSAHHPQTPTACATVHPRHRGTERDTSCHVRRRGTRVLLRARSGRRRAGRACRVESLIERLSAVDLRSESGPREHQSRMRPWPAAVSTPELRLQPFHCVGAVRLPRTNRLPAPANTRGPRRCSRPFVLAPKTQPPHGARATFAANATTSNKACTGRWQVRHVPIVQLATRTGQTDAVLTLVNASGFMRVSVSGAVRDLCFERGLLVANSPS
jgi:hypothetical protein